MFSKAIARVLADEPRDEWRETIRGQHCFARCWHDAEERTFCTEMDCDLRQLCEATWESVCGGIEYSDDDTKPTITVAETLLATPARWRFMRDKQRKLAKKTRKFSWSGTGRYSRVPYVDQGRPIDKIVFDLWTFLGGPPTLPYNWRYPLSQTREQEEQARLIFIEKFGDGLFVIRRTSWHQYFHNGYHLFRIWVNAASGGWVDVIRILARALLADDRNIVKKVPYIGKYSKFRFYPYRAWLSKPGSIERFKKALTRLREFEYLVKEQ
jgi:hypothetical protein